jgi:hypothetical protein
MFYSNTYVALKDRDILCVRRQEAADEDISYVLPTEGALTLPDGKISLFAASPPMPHGACL